MKICDTCWECTEPKKCQQTDCALYEDRGLELEMDDQVNYKKLKW